MKSNAISLVSVVILGVSFAGVVSYQGYQTIYGTDFGKSSLSDVAISKDSDKEKDKDKVPIPDAVLRSKIEQVRPRLNQLHHPKQVSAGSLNMGLVGFSAQALEQSERILEQAKEDYRERIISMAYVSGDSRFAVIDGRLYREGDDFGDTGAKIKTIHPDKVLIAGRDVRQWLDVHNTSTAVDHIGKSKGPAAPKEQAAPVMAAKTPDEKEKKAGSGTSIEEGIQALKGYNDMMKALQGQ
ncbi:MAG: hypothetical protein HQL64_03965 [Magnetococcales bacterium]|nr:hypothetical protein [Magnetococcales bacterium]